MFAAKKKQMQSRKGNEICQEYYIYIYKMEQKLT